MTKWILLILLIGTSGCQTVKVIVEHRINEDTTIKIEIEQ